MFNYGIIKCHSRQPSAHLAAPTEQVSFRTKAACFTVGCMAAHIAGNFGGRKLSRIGENTIFAGKTFADCSLLLRQRTPCPQISQRTHSRIATKPRDLRKFSPLKVSRHTVHHSPSTNSFPPCTSNYKLPASSNVL